MVFFKANDIHFFNCSYPPSRLSPFRWFVAFLWLYQDEEGGDSKTKKKRENPGQLGLELQLRIQTWGPGG